MIDKSIKSRSNLMADTTNKIDYQKDISAVQMQ
jgi:hypothetical protein